MRRVLEPGLSLSGAEWLFLAGRTAAFAAKVLLVYLLAVGVLCL